MTNYDLPITQNPLLTREDLAKALISILEPCKTHLVQEGAGLFNYNGGCTYSEKVVLFEGWSRLLWGIVPLKKGGFTWRGDELHKNGYRIGPDPNSKYYWGDVKDFDQKIVEMASISLSLLLLKEEYWDPLTAKEKQNLYSWLYSVNSKEFSKNNWLFFRILINIALLKLNLPYSKDKLEQDLTLIDNMYVSDGWYKDKVPFDYYNPFAIQYYSLIYYHFMKDIDKERCNSYKNRVIQFAQQYIHFIGEEGGFVPYGRSQTYRFASLSFFSACVFADIEVIPWSIIKGIIFRGFRWWFKQPIFDKEGMLTIGYLYPNLMMSEQYNAPGSPYWALKSFLVLAVDKDHEFWKRKEDKLPTLENPKLLKVPNMLMMRTSDKDVVMLNGGQYPLFQMNSAPEKYSKFAYSIKWGFSTSISNYGFEKLGCDSMLFVSLGDGYWRARRECKVEYSSTEYIKTTWSPYSFTQITTYLIPYQNYHIRIHHIASEQNLITREGGFAIPRYNSFEQEREDEILLTTSLVAIKKPWATTLIKDIMGNRKTMSVYPTPNLNLNYPAVIVPILEGSVEKETVFVSIVGASSSNNSSFIDEIPLVSYDAEKHSLVIGERKIVLL